MLVLVMLLAAVVAAITSVSAFTSPTPRWQSSLISNNKHTQKFSWSLHQSSTTTNPVSLTKDASIIKNTPNFGETGGAMLVLEEGLLVRGDTELVKGMNWSVMPGERVGLVGQNGAGKSTLLAAIAGVRRVESGKLLVKNGARLGYLVQTAVSGSTKTVWEEACSQMDKINDARIAMEAAEARVEADLDGNDSKALECLLESISVFEAVGGYTQDKTVAEVLRGLGFETQDYNSLCEEFSGGWQMRIALARMLLSDSDLLLLDEPTNHLDKAAKSWLGKYVSSYEGTVVTVSHDEDFLENIRCTAIAEVANSKLEIFKGCGYKKYLVERDERVRLAVAKYEKEQEEMAKMQTVIDRFGAKTMGASMAKDRQKKLEKMASAAIENPTELKRKVIKARMKLPNPPPCYMNQIVLKNASFGWTDGISTVKNVNLKLVKGERLVILGPNGAGKSTLLRAISGILPIQTGSRVEGEGLNMGVFTQDLAQDLPHDVVALDHVLSAVRQYDTAISDEQARSVLGGLGLSGAKALRPIGWLSGGEKARVALAIFVMIPHNLLLLDEPSNHLDTETLQTLSEAIRNWQGTVVIVSHNREFVESIMPTHVAIVNKGTMESHNRGPLPEDWEWEEGNVTETPLVKKTSKKKKKERND